MRTAAINSRGRRMRALYWVETPWPHMIRYDAHSATSTIAALATSCSLGSKRWIVELVMKSPPLLEIGRAEDELEPDVEQQTDAVLEQVGEDQVRVDERVQVAFDAAKFVIERLQKRKVHGSVRRD